MLKKEIIERNSKMTRADLTKRIDEIDEEVRSKDITSEEIEERTEELEDLQKRLKDIEDAEKRAKDLKDIAGGAPTEIKERTEKVEVMTRDSEEYRSLWFKSLRGDEMTDKEKRAWTSASGSAGPAIPTQTAANIIEKIKTYAPLLDEITLLNVPGNVKFAIEGTTADAAKHTENASISADSDTLSSVSLSGYEITKLIQISKTVMKMSIPAFETFVEDTIARKLAEKINAYIITGTGSSQPKGIEYIDTWTADTNEIVVAAASSLSEANVMSLIGLLPARYDAKAKFVMSKKTLFSDFMPLQNKSKNDLVQVVGNKFYVYGYEVLFNDDTALHDAYLGDASTLVGNLAEEINITMVFDVDTNSYKILGAGLFDCSPSLTDAYVKLTKAASGN